MFCYCALSVPDNSYDLTSDRDEWGSYKVRPKIILSPIYLESTFIAKVNSGRVAIIGKKHSLDREGENICEDSHLRYWYFKWHVSFLVRFPLCLLFRKAVALGTGSWRNPLKAPLWRFNTFNTPVDSQSKNMELKVMKSFVPVECWLFCWSIRQLALIWCLACEERCINIQVEIGQLTFKSKNFFRLLGYFESLYLNLEKVLTSLWIQDRVFANPP